MIKKGILIMLAFFTIGKVFGQTPSTEAAKERAKAEAQKIGGLKNLYKIDDGIYRSEQPASGDFFLFEKNGIKEVINLRRLKDDKKKAKKTSLSLYHIPMKAGSISNPEVTRALKLIRDRKGPVLIHCWHGSDRTGMLCAMYRVVFQDWSKDEAINEMTKGNFGFHPTYKNIVDYVRNADVAAMKKDLFGEKVVTSSGPSEAAPVIATVQ